MGCWTLSDPAVSVSRPDVGSGGCGHLMCPLLSNCCIRALHPRLFSRYADNECGYGAALASKGNGSEDVRHVCIAMLDMERAQHMEAVQPIP